MREHKQLFHQHHGDTAENHPTLCLAPTCFEQPRSNTLKDHTPGVPGPCLPSASRDRDPCAWCWACWGPALLLALALASWGAHCRQCNASVPHTAGDQLLLNLPALYIKCFRHEDPFPTVSPAQYIATFHLPPSQTEVEESTPASFRRSKTGIKALNNTPHPFRDVNVSQTCLY